MNRPIVISLCVLAGCSKTTMNGVKDAGSGAVPDMSTPVATLRLVWPPPASVVYTSRPQLRVDDPGGAGIRTIVLCADRNCSTELASIDGGAAPVPPIDLKAGPVFWKAVDSSGGSTEVWPFMVATDSIPKRGARIPFLDVDGDGRPDLALGRPYTNGASGELLVLRSAGAPLTASSPMDRITGIAGSGLGGRIAPLGDVDGDGYGDLAVSDGGHIDVFRGSPTGLIPTPALLTMDTLPMATSGVGDLNGDGFADVVTGAVGPYSGGPSAVYLGGSSSLIPLPVSLSANPTAVGDLDGDDIADIIDDCHGGTSVCIRFGGAEPFQRFVELPLPAGYKNPLDQSVIGCGDVNGDGYADAAAWIMPADQSPSSDELLQIVLGGTSPQLGNAVALGKFPPADGVGLLAAAGDLDGDGYDDVIANGFEATTSDNGVRIYFGSASGLRSTPVVVPLPVSTSGVGYYPMAGGVDLDGDGRPDFVVTIPQLGNGPGGGDPGATFIYHGGPGGVRDATSPTRLPVGDALAF